MAIVTSTDFANLLSLSPKIKDTGEFLQIAKENAAVFPQMLQRANETVLRAANDKAERSQEIKLERMRNDQRSKELTLGGGKDLLRAALLPALLQETVGSLSEAFGGQDRNRRLAGEQLMKYFQAQGPTGGGSTLQGLNGVLGELNNTRDQISPWTTGTRGVLAGAGRS